MKIKKWAGVTLVVLAVASVDLTLVGCMADRNASGEPDRWDAPVRQVLLLTPDGAPSEVEQIARVFTRHLRNRCGSRVVRQGHAPLTVRLALTKGVGPEGYVISDSDGGILVAGNGVIGLLHGVGRLLRTSRFDQDGFSAGSWRGSSVPQKLFRAIYLATNKGNTYHVATVKQISEYIEDMGLLGYNTVLVWRDTQFYHSPEEQAMVEYHERLFRYLEAARDVGMKVGLVDPSNLSYENLAPEQLRATKRFSPELSVKEICPSKPGGQKLILDLHRDFYELLAERGIHLSHVSIWGYDPGGCYCDLCSPWDNNGYLASARALANLIHEMFDDCTISLSTWGCEPDGWYEIWEKDPPAWLDYVAYALGKERKIAEHRRLPESVRPLNFPDLCNGRRATIWGPARGGFGANPVPGLIQEAAPFYKEQDGGFPYSEGIWDDLNKALVAHLYWNPDGNVYEAMKEYISSEFSPEAVDEVAEAVEILEQNAGFFKSIDNEEKSAPADTQKALELMKSADGKLPEQARNAWRWRILYLRAVVDSELQRTGGKLEGTTLQTAFDELRRIYQYDKKPVKYVGVPMQGW